QFVKATANGRKVNVNGHTNVIDAVQVYDNDGTAHFYSTNGLAGMAGDHCKLTPGPGSGGPTKLTSIDTISFIGNGPSGYAGGTLDVILDIYDTYTTTASPINTGPLLHFVATTAVLPAVPAGTYYIMGPLDITASNVTVPDDDFVAVVRVCNTGTTVAATGVMPTFCGLPYPLLTG